ncbi:hypothetical protein [Clostridium cuniculi]|uniref:hypothetical protein n=1 Tax=Clostridium cuniculi TaxID=2548455 RepID=UPI0010555017|nr:hypothetical protein [Clostridium cuniculi]
MNAILYVGYYRDYEVSIEINENDITNGYKAIKCLECEGTGIWDYVDYIPIEDCICCKGTGIVLINV